MSQLEIFYTPRIEKEALYVDGKLKLVLEQSNVGLGDAKYYTPIKSIEEYYIKNFDDDNDFFPGKIVEFPAKWEVVAYE